MYGMHDVCVETVPDAKIVEPADALVRVTRAGICGSAGTELVATVAVAQSLVAQAGDVFTR